MACPLLWVAIRSLSVTAKPHHILTSACQSNYLSLLIHSHSACNAGLQTRSVEVGWSLLALALNMRLNIINNVQTNCRAILRSLRPEAPQFSGTSQIHHKFLAATDDLTVLLYSTQIIKALFTE